MHFIRLRVLAYSHGHCDSVQSTCGHCSNGSMQTICSISMMQVITSPDLTNLGTRFERLPERAEGPMQLVKIGHVQAECPTASRHEGRSAELVLLAVMGKDHVVLEGASQRRVGGLFNASRFFSQPDYCVSTPVFLSMADVSSRMTHSSAAAWTCKMAV